MNKGQQFWLNVWQKKERPRFHLEGVHPDLIAYWPALNLPAGARVLVPLCGKSQDMLWLVAQGFQVIGIELSEEAIEQFVCENKLNLTKHGLRSNQIKQTGKTKTTDSDLIKYSNDSLTIWVGDIFHLNKSQIEPVDAIYDRAALIALPEELRPSYVQTCLQWLKPQGKILLKTLSYDQSEMIGPPFSLSEEEIHRLYKDYHLNLCETTATKNIDSTQILSSLKQRGSIRDDVWLISNKD